MQWLFPQKHFLHDPQNYVNLRAFMDCRIYAHIVEMVEVFEDEQWLNDGADWLES